MINALLRFYHPRVWAEEEGRICPKSSEYSTGLVLDETVIEKHILPLVRVLNQQDLGVKTIACCQGHYFSQRTPYVYFHCPVPLAAQIAKLLYQHSILERKTYFSWSLHPRFNQDFQICFSLAPESFCQTSTGRVSGQRLWREFLSHDFSILSDLCNQVYSAFSYERMIDHAS